MVKAALIGRHDLIRSPEKIRGNGTLDCLFQQSFMVDFAELRFADLEHDAPVGSCLRL